MYKEPLHCIREYVQNAYDSIREARRAGILEPEEGAVWLIVDEEDRTLRIRDNGNGLAPEAAAVCLHDLGSSEKATSDKGASLNAGFRGIGRMAGISYCKTLRFETSDGKGRKCTVEFDAAGINRLTRAGQKPTTIVDAVRQHSEIGENPEVLDKHYLEVTLKGITKEESPFLKQKHLAEYLQQTAPVAYDPSSWSYGPKIQSFAEKFDSPKSLEHIAIYICDHDQNVQVDVRRPFKNTFSTVDGRRKNYRNVRVKDVIELPRDGDVANGWWGWLAEHERNGALTDAPYAGLRIRMHNIEIGNEEIIKRLFTTQAQARWCFGEIHVTNFKVTPNAQRDDFEPSPTWRQIEERLRNEAKRIEREVRKESEDRNRSSERVVKRANKKAKSAQEALSQGIVSRDQKETLLDGLVAEAENLEQEKSKKRHSEAGKKQLSEAAKRLRQVAKEIESVKRTSTDDALAHLDKRTRRVVFKILKVLKCELDETKFRNIEEKINSALQPGRPR